MGIAFRHICLSVCALMLGTCIFYSSYLACIDSGVKGQGHTVTKTDSQLLVTVCGCATCGHCRTGSACWCDCLCSL